MNIIWMVLCKILKTIMYTSYDMVKDELSETLEEPGMSLFRKIITWIVVLSITIMFVLMIIFQPRFFTFLD